MALFNPEGRVQESNPLTHEHIGVVIDVNDPKNLARVRVVIPNLLEPDNEVWFSRITPNFPGVTYATPRLGQKIRVWFTDNSISSGVYGLDYVHKDTGLSIFEPGDYGFADLNSNSWKVRGTNTTYTTGSFTMNTNCFSVTGKISSGSAYTGSFSTGDGRIVNVEGGIITSVE